MNPGQQTIWQFMITPWEESIRILSISFPAVRFPSIRQRIPGSVAWTDTLMGLTFRDEIRSISRSDRLVRVM